jgi:hypothetical protein
MRLQNWCSISHHPVLIKSDFTISNETKNRINHWFNQEINKPQRKDIGSLLGGNYIATSSSMYRKSMLDPKKLRRIKNITAVDFVLIALACENGDIGFINEKFSAYRLHSSNYWATMELERQQIEIAKIDKFLSRILEKEFRKTFIMRLEKSAHYLK